MSHDLRPADGSSGGRASRSSSGANGSARLGSGGTPRQALVTGGAGFVGSNLVDRLARTGWHVRVLDDLSRPGVEQNAAWLERIHGPRVELRIGDVVNAETLGSTVSGVDAIFHLAAQVAVTHSLSDPLHDFEVNAGATVQLVEAVRTSVRRPLVIFSSTNKVYGNLEDIPLRETPTRYEPCDAELRRRGVDERRALDFHSPYGCSKGAAEQYVLDAGRSFGLRTCVFRMSCIYGPRQCGSESQGWVAHFLKRAVSNQSITLYGDGKQVRDVLYVDDLVRAFEMSLAQPDAVVGRAFNVGGGPANTTSLLELVDRIEALQERRPTIRFEEWRTGDQRYYVSDVGRLQRAIGWAPSVPLHHGLERLHSWVRDQRALPGRRTAGSAARARAGGAP